MLTAHGRSRGANGARPKSRYAPSSLSVVRAPLFCARGYYCDVSLYGFMCSSGGACTASPLSVVRAPLFCARGYHRDVSLYGFMCSSGGACTASPLSVVRSPLFCAVSYYCDVNLSFPRALQASLAALFCVLRASLTQNDGQYQQ